jgi:HSP90 family molecular chaperone
MNEYKGKKFVSIESAYEEIQKDLGIKPEDQTLANRLPEEDVTSFCLWLKNELQDSISKVQISKRLKDTPALVTGQMSSSMRVMMQMMEAQGQAPGNAAEMSRMSKDNTLELNAGHPIVVNLNQLRKTNKDMATLVAKQLLDNVMISSGIPFDLH